MLSAAAVYAQLFEKESDAVLSLAKDFDSAKYYKQLREGKAHPLWLLGHIANTNNFLINMSCCGGSNQLPKEWHPKFSPDFAGGIAPTPEADFYPSWDELVEQFSSLSECCIKGIGNLSDEALVADLGVDFPEAIRVHFKTVDNTLRTVILHSAYHRGQMALINLQD